METTTQENILFLTSKEVTQILRITPRTLQNYRSNGRINYHKISNKKILYPAKDVYELIQKSSLASITKDRAAYLISKYLVTN